MHPFPHHYRIDAEAVAAGRVVLRHAGVEPIESAPPIEFGGPGDAWSPEGQRLHSIAVPASQSSCPAFAGPDAARIVVTSAWKGMDDESRRADPQAGKTFLVDSPVRGRFEPKVLI